MNRSVLFDIDGVLVNGYPSQPDRRRWHADLLADLGVDPDRFDAEFIHDLFVKQVIVGRMSLLDALERSLPRLGYRGPALAFVGYWLSHDSDVNVQMLDLARRLKEAGECRLLLATNQEHMRAQWLWQTLKFGEVFEDMFHSARVGHAKPSSAYFDWVGNRLGPQDIPPLFFDDREDIVRAARAHGWEAVQVNDYSDVATHPWVAERLR